MLIIIDNDISYYNMMILTTWRVSEVQILHLRTQMIDDDKDGFRILKTQVCEDVKENKCVKIDVQKCHTVIEDVSSIVNSLSHCLKQKYKYKGTYKYIYKSATQTFIVITNKNKCTHTKPSHLHKG